MVTALTEAVGFETLAAMMDAPLRRREMRLTRKGVIREKKESGLTEGRRRTKGRILHSLGAHIFKEAHHVQIPSSTHIQRGRHWRRRHHSGPKCWSALRRAIGQGCLRRLACRRTRKAAPYYSRCAAGTLRYALVLERGPRRRAN